MNHPKNNTRVLGIGLTMALFLFSFSVDGAEVKKENLAVKEINLDVDLEGVRDPFESPLPKKQPNTIPLPPPPVSDASPPTPPPVPPRPQALPSPAPPSFTPVGYQPPPPAAGNVGNMEVTGIIWNSDRPQAIINGKVVEMGDEVNGLKIVKIEKTGVELGQAEGLTKTLKIKK